MKKLFLIFILILSSCDNPPPPEGPDISFTKYQPIYFDVAKIDIVDEYKSPMRMPNVEHLLPISPAEAMHIWVKDRLHGAGMENRMQVIIQDASVKVTQLEKPEGMTGFLTNSQDKKYDAKLAVEIRIYSPESAISQASVTASVTRSITIDEKSSVAERTAIFKQFIHDLMEGMNAQLEQNIYMYFGKYISYSHSP